MEKSTAYTSVDIFAQTDNISALIYPRRAKSMAHTEYTNFFSVIEDDAEKALELETRALMMVAIRNMIDDKQWSQAEAAGVLGISQPRVSYLKAGRLDKFKLDTLVRLLCRLGYVLMPKYDAKGLTVDVKRVA